MKPYNYKPSKLFTKPYLSTDYLLYSFYVPNAHSEDSQISKLRIFHRLLVKIDKLFDRNITGYFSFIYNGTLHYYFEGEVLNENRSNFPQHALSANTLVGLVDYFETRYEYNFRHSLSHHLNTVGDKSGISPYDEAKQYLKDLRILYQAKSDINASYSTLELKVIPDRLNESKDFTEKLSDTELQQKIIDLWLCNVKSKFSEVLNPAFFQIELNHWIETTKEFNPECDRDIELMLEHLNRLHAYKSREILNQLNEAVVIDSHEIIGALMKMTGKSTDGKKEAIDLAIFHFLLLYDMVNLGEAKPKKLTKHKPIQKMLTRKKRLSEQQRLEKETEDKWIRYISNLRKPSKK